MNWKDFFTRKKTSHNDEKLDLNDDVYIDDEMKTFNPEEQNLDDSTYQTMTQTLTQDQSTHVHVMQKAVQDQLKAEQIKVDFTPLTYNDIQKAAWMLQHAKKVVVSVEKMTAEDRSRTLNFFAGMIYALNGNVEHYSRNIFIFKVTSKTN